MANVDATTADEPAAQTWQDWEPHRLVSVPLRGLAQVCLCPSYLSGVAIFIGLCIGNEWLAVLALLASIVSSYTAMAFGFDASFVDQGLASYNGVLVGCGFAVFLGFDRWSWQSAVATLFGAAASALVSKALAELSESPAWTWGFNLCLFVVLARTEPDLSPPPPSDLDLWSVVRAVPIGVSQIYCAETSLGGLIILLGLAAHSVKMASAAAVGSAMGMLTAMLVGGDASFLVKGLYGYNPALTAIVVQVFFEPTWQMLCLMICGTAGTQVISMGLASIWVGAFKAPVGTIPFCIGATLCFKLRGTCEGLRAPGEGKEKNQQMTDDGGNMDAADSSGMVDVERV